MTNLENLKNEQIPKKEKKMLNIVISKQENHILWRKIAIKIRFQFSRKKKNFLIADTNLQVDEIKRKMEAKFNKPLFN